MTKDTFPSIPGYTILRQLGQGGMGAVYLGQSTEDSTKQVAIKVISRPMGDDNNHSFITRFKREIEICQGLAHENIVSTIAGGVSERGALYLVLEFLPGCTLEERASKERLSEEKTILIGLKLCDALNCIHNSGLYHRDIKPANIVLHENFEPILIDFGLALANNRTRLTETGLALGTLQTMAPEQLMGKKISESADIYSLGATLFFSVTGAYPFSEEEIIAVATGMPRRTNLVDKLKGKVSDSFIDVLLCALEINPQKRFLSAELFKEALGDFRKKLPTSKKSKPSGGHAKVGYRKTLLSLVLLFAAAAAIIIPLSLEQTPPSQSTSHELLQLRRHLLG